MIKILGVSFHSSNWQNIDFENKRVAVIGNGSTGIQIAANLAKIPNIYLTHFIRSGGYYFPKVNWKYPSYLKTLFATFPILNRLHRLYIFYYVSY